MLSGMILNAGPLPPPSPSPPLPPLPPPPSPPPSLTPSPPPPPSLPPHGKTTTLVGSTSGYNDGVGGVGGTGAKFYGPANVAIDPSGTFALVCDRTRIRRVNVTT